ncbi:hypothetical protein EYS14_02335 [Alteromonadaceae bacterium M269]|nr:hypothetical protein EYS14_02335 [Alteromonadaceae bacterium M269]
MSKEPDCREYSLSELDKALENIEKNSYPKHVKQVESEVLVRKRHGEYQTNLRGGDSLYYTIPSGNWLKLHWNGLFPLGIAYWVNVFAISLAFTFSINFLPDYISSINASPSQRGLVIVALYITMTTVTVWQLVGLYRSASMHVERGGMKVWALTAKALVFLGGMKFSYEMLEIGIPFVVESSNLIVGNTTLPPHSIRLMNDATEIEVQGGLEFGLTEELSGYLNHNSNIKIIHLNSLGGRLAEAVSLASLIKAYDLKTYVKTQCLSACPIAFLAGQERLLGDKAELGFHSASFGGVSGSETKELNERLITELKKAGIPKSFIKKITSTSADDIWTPSHEELLKANLVDEIVDPGDYAISGISDWKKPDSVEREMLQHRLYEVIQNFDEEGYSFIKKMINEGITEGTPTNKLTRNIQSYLHSNRLSYYLSKGGDSEVIQYERTQVSQMKYLQGSFPKECASYMYPELFDRNTLKNTSNTIEPSLSNDGLEALIGLIESISPTRKSLLSEKEQRDIIASILKKVESGALINVYAKPSEHIKEPQILCRSAILFSEAVLALPNVKASAMIRSFY